MPGNIKKSKNNRNKDKRKYRKRRTNKNKLQISKVLKSKKQLGGAGAGAGAAADTAIVNYKSPKDRALHDSIHDFKTLISDVIHFNRKTNKISLHRTIFTFLLKQCFSDISNIKDIAEKCGRYTSSAMRIGSCCVDLENAFLYDNINTAQNTLADNIYHFKEQPNGEWIKTDYNGNSEVLNKNHLDEMADMLRAAGWGSFGGMTEEKINLMVDTQKRFFKDLQNPDAQKQWRYILTKESIFDPAGKINGKQKSTYEKKIGENNYYWECVNNSDVSRTYRINQVTGKYNITLEKHEDGWFDKRTNRPMVKYIFTDAVDSSKTYSDKAIMSSGANHPNSIGQVKKLISKEQKVTLDDYQRDIAPEQLYTDMFAVNNQYYNNHVDNYTALIETYARELSKKRYSDELMAEVCRYVLTFDDTANQEVGIKVEEPEGNHSFFINISNPLVLLTYDRMLFVAGLENHKQIPCILDKSDKKKNGGEYYLYIPDKTNSSSQANDVYSFRGGGITVLKGGAAAAEHPTSAAPLTRSMVVDNDYYLANPIVSIKYMLISGLKDINSEVAALQTNRDISSFSTWLRNNKLTNNSSRIGRITSIPPKQERLTSSVYSNFKKLIELLPLKEIKLSFRNDGICITYNNNLDEKDQLMIEEKINSHLFDGYEYSEHLAAELDKNELVFVHYSENELYTVSIMNDFFKYTNYKFLDEKYNWATWDKSESKTYILMKDVNIERNAISILEEEQSMEKDEQEEEEDGGLTRAFNAAVYRDGNDGSAAANGSGGGGWKGSGGGEIKNNDQNKKFVTDIQDILHILKEYETLILFDEEESYKYYFDDGVDRYFKLVNYWELNFLMKELCLRKKRSENISGFMHYLYTASDDNLFTKRIYNDMIDIISYVFSDRDPIIFFENAGSDYEPLEFKVFMNKLAKKYNNIEVKRQNLFTSLENQNISTEELKKIAKTYSSYSSYGFTEMYYNLVNNEKEEKKTTPINLNISKKVNKDNKRLSQKFKKGKNNGTQKSLLRTSVMSPLSKRLIGQ